MECISKPLLNTGDALDKYQIAAQELEALLTKDSGDAEIQGFITQIPEIILKCVCRDEAALTVAQQVLKSLHENASNSLQWSHHVIRRPMVW